MGAGMLLAALNVRYRDVKYTIPFVTQIGLFVTPIIYPVTFLPHRFQGWLALNPMTGIDRGFSRLPVRGRDQLEPDRLLLGSSLWCCCVLGGLHFRSTERVFADIV